MLILRISSYFKGISSHVHLPLFVGSGSTVKFLPHRAGPAQVKGLMGMSKALDILYLYILYIYIHWWWWWYFFGCWLYKLGKPFHIYRFIYIFPLFCNYLSTVYPYIYLFIHSRRRDCLEQSATKNILCIIFQNSVYSNCQSLPGRVYPQWWWKISYGLFAVGWPPLHAS